MLPLETLEAMLVNWAAWAGGELVKLGYPPTVIGRFYRPFGDGVREEGWGDYEGAIEATQIAVNALQAETLDGILLQMRVPHWHRIRRRYLWHQPVDRMKLDEALRALSDLIEHKPHMRERLL